MMQFISDNWWVFALCAIGCYLVAVVGWFITVFCNDSRTLTGSAASAICGIVSFVLMAIVANLFWVFFIIGAVCQIIKFAKNA